MPSPHPSRRRFPFLLISFFVVYRRALPSRHLFVRCGPCVLNQAAVGSCTSALSACAKRFQAIVLRVNVTCQCRVAPIVVQFKQAVDTIAPCRISSRNEKDSGRNLNQLKRSIGFCILNACTCASLVPSAWFKRAVRLANHREGNK